MSKETIQRTRSTNFTNNEKLLALNIIKKYTNILENKKTGAITWKEKNEAWNKIEEEYNSQSSVFRSKDTLKKFYDNKKRETRKICADEKKEIYSTGGGLPSNYIKYDATVELTKEMMNKKTIDGLNNPFDGDSLTVNVESGTELTDMLIASEEIDDNPSISLLNPITWATYKVQNLKTPVSQELLYEKSEENVTQDQLVKISNAKTPKSAVKRSRIHTNSSDNRKTATKVSEWSNRRRPKPELHASNISKQYSDLAEVKLELAKLELDILKSSNEARLRREEEEHNLKVMALKLDIKIKEHTLKKLISDL